jgi:hypothetical protein
MATGNPEPNIVEFPFLLLAKIWISCFCRTAWEKAIVERIKISSGNPEPSLDFPVSSSEKRQGHFCLQWEREFKHVQFQISGR